MAWEIDSESLKMTIGDLDAFYHKYEDDNPPYNLNVNFYGEGRRNPEEPFTFSLEDVTFDIYKDTKEELVSYSQDYIDRFIEHLLQLKEKLKEIG